LAGACKSIAFMRVFREALIKSPVRPEPVEG
jgi:hypothetical protein